MDDGRRENRKTQRPAAEGGPGGTPDAAGLPVACPSITQPSTRQKGGEGEGEEGGFPVFAIDWWESAGCVRWEAKSREVFEELERCQQMAEQYREPYRCSLGDGQILVYERGMGTGRASRLEFRLEWCGVTMGLSPRREPDRKLSNFYLKVTGEACVIIGAERVRETLFGWLEEWGGSLFDEWCRRLDVCLDLPGLAWQDALLPACAERRFVASARRTGLNYDGDQPTGFTVGGGALRMTIYDKLYECLRQKPEAYGQAMIQGRWGSRLPKAATRIEYQIRREWFGELGLNDASQIWRHLRDIVERITRTENHPFFMLTDRVPDREGRHQGRAEVLSVWLEIVDSFRRQSGEPVRPLARLERGVLNARKAVASAIGYIITAAAQLELSVESVEDLVAAFQELLRRNDVSDEMIRLKWEGKARRLGTLRSVEQFPFGDNLAV